MKIILIGATGNIGKPLHQHLIKKHEVVAITRKNGAIPTDINNESSVKAMFEKIGGFDALVNVSGAGYMGPFTTMTQQNFIDGLHDKLVNQINLVLIGKHYINPEGSFTLTSGALVDDPIAMGSNISVVNAGLDAFARAAAIELKNGVRINTVSPGLLEPSAEAYGSYFPGFIPVPISRVIFSYIKSIEGKDTGKTYKVH